MSEADASAAKFSGCHNMSTAHSNSSQILPMRPRMDRLYRPGRADTRPGFVAATSVTRTVLAVSDAIERGREIDEAQELGPVTIRIGATMLLGERTC